VQIRLLRRLQESLELSFYKYAQKHVPDTLKSKGWTCPEAVELHQWAHHFIGRPDLFAEQHRERWTVSGWATMFQDMTRLRHAAVHRSQMSMDELHAHASGAESVFELLGDQAARHDAYVITSEIAAASSRIQSKKELYAKDLRTLENEFDQKADELGQLERAMEEDFQRKRAELDRLEKVAHDDYQQRKKTLHQLEEAACEAIMARSKAYEDSVATVLENNIAKIPAKLSTASDSLVGQELNAADSHHAGLLSADGSTNQTPEATAPSAGHDSFVKGSSSNEKSNGSTVDHLVLGQQDREAEARRLLRNLIENYDHYRDASNAPTTSPASITSNIMSEASSSSSSSTDLSTAINEALEKLNAPSRGVLSRKSEDAPRTNFEISVGTGLARGVHSLRNEDADPENQSVAPAEVMTASKHKRARGRRSLRQQRPHQQKQNEETAEGVNSNGAVAIVPPTVPLPSDATADRSKVLMSQATELDDEPVATGRIGRLDVSLPVRSMVHGSEISSSAESVQRPLELPMQTATSTGVQTPVYSDITGSAKTTGRALAQTPGEHQDRWSEHKSWSDSAPPALQTLLGGVSTKDMLATVDVQGLSAVELKQISRDYSISSPQTPPTSSPKKSTSAETRRHLELEMVKLVAEDGRRCGGSIMHMIGISLKTGSPTTVVSTRSKRIRELAGLAMIGKDNLLGASWDNVCQAVIKQEHTKKRGYSNFEIKAAEVLVNEPSHRRALQQYEIESALARVTQWRALVRAGFDEWLNKLGCTDPTILSVVQGSGIFEDSQVEAECPLHANVADRVRDLAFRVRMPWMFTLGLSAHRTLNLVPSVISHSRQGSRRHVIREFVNKLKEKGLSFALKFPLSRYGHEFWPLNLIKMVRGRRKGEAEFPEDEQVTAFIEAYLERDRLQGIFKSIAWSLRRNFPMVDLPFGIQDGCNLDLGGKADVTQLHESVKEFPPPSTPATTSISVTSSALMEFSTSWLQNRQSTAGEGDLEGREGESNMTAGTQNVQPAQPAFAEEAPSSVLLSASELTSPAIGLGDDTIASLESFDEHQWAKTEIELKKTALHLRQENNLVGFTGNWLTTNVGQSRAESQESYNATALEFYREHAIVRGAPRSWLRKADLLTFQKYLACAMSLLKRIEIQFHHRRKQKQFKKEMKALVPARPDIAQGDAKPTTHSMPYSTTRYEIGLPSFRFLQSERHQEQSVPDPKALHIMPLKLHRENSLTLDDNQTVTSNNSSSVDEVTTDSAIISGDPVGISDVEAHSLTPSNVQTVTGDECSFNNEVAAVSSTHSGDYVDNSEIKTKSPTPDDAQTMTSDETSTTEEVGGVAATDLGDHVDNSSIEATSELAGVNQILPKTDTMSNTTHLLNTQSTTVV
jgi:hypothetical protein